MNSLSLRLTILSFMVIICLTLGCAQQKDKDDVDEKAGIDLSRNEIPQVVMAGLEKRFPNAEVHKWTKEKEGDIVVYDIEFTQEGQKFEADIKEDGTIYNWEKAIESMDLPEAVQRAVAEEYPAAILREVMEITTVSDGKDVLEGYEISVVAEGRDVEVTIAPDGTILEDFEEEE